MSWSSPKDLHSGVIQSWGMRSADASGTRCRGFGQSSGSSGHFVNVVDARSPVVRSWSVLIAKVFCRGNFASRRISLYFSSCGSDGPGIAVLGEHCDPVTFGKHSFMRKCGISRYPFRFKVCPRTWGFTSRTLQQSDQKVGFTSCSVGEVGG